MFLGHPWTLRTRLSPKMAGNSQEEENFDQTLHHCDQQSVQAERLAVQSEHFAAESFPIEAAGATCQGAGNPGNPRNPPVQALEFRRQKSDRLKSIFNEDKSHRLTVASTSTCSEELYFADFQSFRRGKLVALKTGCQLQSLHKKSINQTLETNER